MVTVRPWKVDSLARLGLGLLLGLSLGGLLASLLEPPEAFPLARFLLTTLSFHCATFLFVHVFLRENGDTWSGAFGLRVSGAGRVVMLAAGLTVLVLPGVWVLSSLSVWGIRWMQMEPEAQQAVMALREAADPLQQVVMSGVAVLVAPAAEETLFRGVLYPAGKRWLGGAGSAVLTAMVFAVIHANLMTLVPLFFLALFFTWLYERTGTLMAPVIGHAVFNLANVIFLLAGLGPT